MRRKLLVLAFTGLLVGVAFASWQGDFQKAGITSDGTNITIAGNLTVGGTSTVTGAQTVTTITGANGETIANATDAVVAVTYNDDAVEVGDFQFITSNTSGEDANYFRTSWWFEDDGSVSTEAAYIDVSMDDETSNTFDSTIEWGVVTNDTLAAELNLDGAKLYPETDAGLDLGGSSNEFNDLYIDGTANIDTLAADAGAATALTITNFTMGTQLMKVYTYAADPNAASFAVTCAGVDTDDDIIATVNDTTNGAYLLSAVPGTGVTTVTLSADPAASVRITILAFED